MIAGLRAQRPAPPRTTDRRPGPDRRHRAATGRRPRQVGYPWSAIGASLGITRQATRQRFSTPSQATLTGATQSTSQPGKNEEEFVVGAEPSSHQDRQPV